MYYINASTIVSFHILSWLITPSAHSNPDHLAASNQTRKPGGQQILLCEWDYSNERFDIWVLHFLWPQSLLLQFECDGICDVLLHAVFEIHVYWPFDQYCVLLQFQRWMRMMTRSYSKSATSTSVELIDWASIWWVACWFMCNMLVGFWSWG